MISARPWCDLAITLPERLIALVTEFQSTFPADAVVVAPFLERLESPLRLAIAGRVKTGKSTLLNALVGERLAPTDAGECTKIVSWYQGGDQRTVEADLRDGTRVPLPFTYVDGRLDIDLLDHRPENISRVVVSWPSRRLASVTLIDTPGLQAVDAEAEQRTRQLFADHSDQAGSIDAVLYLMRHVHQSDTSFLDAFLDRSVPHTSPVNAIAVLSRADELGAGSLDAMTVAERIANRYVSDERLTALVGEIIPAAGLLAETAVTFTEKEASSINGVASLARDVVGQILLSVDRVTTSDQLSDGAALLDRLGLFGVRRLVVASESGEARTAHEMARLLAGMSGIDRIREAIAGQFMERAGFLKARAILQSLKAVPSSLVDDEAANWLRGSVEQLEAAAVELALIRALHLARIGAVALSSDEARELSRLTRDHAIRAAVETAEGSTTEVQRRIDYWRRSSQHPMNSHARTELADTMARAYEAVVATVPNIQDQRSDS